MSSWRNTKKPVGPVRAFAQIFLVLATTLSLLALGSAVVNLLSLRNSHIISGTILKLDVVQNAILYTDETSGLHYYPIIQYLYEGETAEYLSPQPVLEDRYQLGDEVELRINTNGKVFLNNIWGIWGSAIVLAGTALIFAISSLAIFRLGLSIHKQAPRTQNNSNK